MNESAYDAKEQSQGFIYYLTDLAGDKFRRLRDTVIADFWYEPSNQYSFAQKEKIFKYLRIKYLAIAPPEEEQKKFTDYDPQCGAGVEFTGLTQMKEVLASIKASIAAAEDTQQQLQAARNMIRARFLSEMAYEFDKQRYCSIGWGLAFGGVLCSTIYARGRGARQMALFLTCGHAFGQISYHYNIDKYFDSVEKIFKEDAEEFTRAEAAEQAQEESRKIRGRSYVDD